MRALRAVALLDLIAFATPLTPNFPHKPKRKSTGFVAFGDSYSAGIGTGVNGTETPCRLGLGAYPNLVHRDLQEVLAANDTTFQHLSCTGANVDDLLSGWEPSQIDDFDTTATADFALMSIGGNDLGFFDIMNSCIFRFYSVGSGTCEAALQRSEAELASPVFEYKLRLAMLEVLDKVQWEKKPWFTITFTGYARFFNDETKECDECSFGVWWRGPKLRRKLRRRMNRMVDRVNEKIRLSVKFINESFAAQRVLFVDYDQAFEGHRFCEPGVIEPDITRNDTWFFLVGGPDNAETGEPSITASHDARPPPIDNDLCTKHAQKPGDWEDLAACMMALEIRDDQGPLATEGEVVTSESMSVPTYYAKTFHPVRVKSCAGLIQRLISRDSGVRDISRSEIRSIKSGGAFRRRSRKARSSDTSVKSRAKRR